MNKNNNNKIKRYQQFMKKFSSPTTKILDLFQNRHQSIKRENRKHTHSKNRSNNSKSAKQNNKTQYSGFQTERSRESHDIFTPNLNLCLNTLTNFNIDKHHKINTITAVNLQNYNTPPYPHTPNTFNIKTYIRFKPFTSNQLVKAEPPIHNIGIISDKSLKIQERVYGFDKVFRAQTTEAEIYQECGENIIQKFLMGYNGTIFAYGQTGSGKTYTMFGENGKGIIPRAVDHIFSKINRKNKENSQNDENYRKYKVQLSMLEIYRQNLIDLLGNSQNNVELKIKQANQTIHVSNLRIHSVNSVEQVLELINKGNEIKKIRETSLNQNSSRSHLILTIYLTVEQKNQIKKSKLNLIDLAGSEKVSKSKVQGDGLEEAKKINLSLACLGNTINALIKGQQHIPYRQSKLTRLLQQSLGGNSITSLVVTCSMNQNCSQETYSSLKFAHRVSKVKTSPILHINNKKQNQLVVSKFLYESLKNQYNQCEKKLQRIKNYINDIEMSKEQGVRRIAEQIKMILGKDSMIYEPQTPQSGHKIIINEKILYNGSEKLNKDQQSNKKRKFNLSKGSLVQEIYQRQQAQKESKIKLKQQQQIKIKQQLIQKDNLIFQMNKKLQQYQSKNGNYLKLKISKFKPKQQKMKRQQKIPSLIQSISQVIDCLEKDKTQYYKFQREVLLCQIQQLMIKLSSKQSVQIQPQRYKIEHQFVDKYIVLLQTSILQLYKFLKSNLQEPYKERTSIQFPMDYKINKLANQNWEEYYKQELLRKKQTIQVLKNNISKLCNKNEQIITYVDIVQRQLAYSKEKISFYQGFRKIGEEIQKKNNSQLT